MENNDSPYIYEKPLRSKSSKQGKRASAIAALGLVGLGGLFGGTAFANSLVASPTSEASGSVRSTIAQAVIAVPLQETKPKSNSVNVAVPSIPNQSFGNTSSATPSASSGSSAYASSPKAGYAERGESGDFENEPESEND